MSKKIRLTAAAGLALLLILAVSLAAILPAARAQQGVRLAPPNTRSAAVVAATASVLKETSEIRQLAILRPVKSGAQSRAEIERMIMKNMDEDETPEEMRASELALKKLGLVPKDFQFRPFIINLLTEQVAGYYDPKTQEFYLADWIDLDGQKPVMAHELTHALQDQHFNLRRFEKWPKGDSDAELAAHALIEGDATLVMKDYVEKNPLRALAFARAMRLSGGSTQQFDQAPRALRESLMFPYEQGTLWSMHVFQRGGYAALSRAYTELPQSTEQILHPEKYFSREAPVKVNLTNLAPMLGAGWKRIDYDVNGEWSYYLILEEFLRSDAESSRAAAGWAGDRYAVYEGPHGSVFITQRTNWDTPKDAQEFLDAYAKRTTRRYTGATQTENSNEGQLARLSWTTNEGSVLIERRGTSIVIAEGVPENANAKTLLASLWR
ncbi:MAG TPA: hypothetical protein VGB17_14175 [Pyrinomonadaceae bacterium]|jgi:hypothetical protein